MERRHFLKQLGNTAVAGGAALSGFWILSRTMQSPPVPHLPVSEPGVLRPPGALDEPEFLAACIRCTRCQDACPSGAIQLARGNAPAEESTPYIVAAENACTLCLDCTTACPTGALLPIEDRTQVAMGTAVVNKLTCVSHNNTGVCGACHTACPLKNKAIVQGLHNAPEVVKDECVGCGLCEEACILKGTKAIRVFSHRRSA